MMVAFYKGKGSFYNRIVRWWTRGPYSHVELVFTNGMSASASFWDGGVRYKYIDYDAKKWTLVQLPWAFEPTAREYFKANVGKKYDLLGNLRFLWGAMKDDRRKLFCSEAVGAALGLKESWRFDPNTLYSVVKMLSKEVRHARA